MNYIYENINHSLPIAIIQGRDFNHPDSDGRQTNSTLVKLITVEKLLIANIHSASITVDVYIEKINIGETEKLYGKSDRHDQNRDDLGNYLNKVSNTHYFIKGLVIPNGAAVDIFDKSCSFSNVYSLNVQMSSPVAANDTTVYANVTCDYMETQDKNYSGGTSQQITGNNY